MTGVTSSTHSHAPAVMLLPDDRIRHAAGNATDERIGDPPRPGPADAAVIDIASGNPTL
jgi:hypothetical protein